MIMCKNNAFISLLWTANIALLCGIPSSTSLLSVRASTSSEHPALTADSPLSHQGFHTDLHLLCHFLPPILQNTSSWSDDCILLYLALFFSFPWLADLSLCLSLVQKIVTWRGNCFLYIVMSREGRGGLTFLMGSNGQGFPLPLSTGSSPQSSYIFLSTWQKESYVPLLFFFFFQVSKLRRSLNGFLRFFSICLANLIGNAYYFWS